MLNYLLLIITFSFFSFANTTTTYQTKHLLEEYYDPSGTRITKNIYDASGRLIQTIDPDGNVVEFTHNLEGQEEIIKDKLGRISVFVYDEEGNVLSQTNPMGETTTRTYDSRGNELTVTDPLGHTTTNTYDSNHNLLETIDALGNTETTTFSRSHVARGNAYSNLWCRGDNDNST